ncbi:outer membrane protein assembly factor BamA [Pyxidicoccus fallax]|uniref:Outer membrane protein assembly factor BamA n=1 Tax=Pyxidicoccus fallax TaxID=394095 RepID=A0A848LNA5_9BACT|nr:outer membrane protein assembly factor BamA [Pyxidicoccus fallax]NMO19337.1 outer membrane protein assembly factor BamA [Pyxidicoccus fallax]NPC79089.1 outer membrane protein assembly factor BamA [Pyxidicoccus fallax]
MRLPVLSRKSLLPLLAVALFSLVPGRVHAQVDGGVSAPAPVPAVTSPSALDPAADADAGTPPATGAELPGDAPVSDEDATDRVVEIRVEGNRRVEAEAIRRALRTKVGEPLAPGRTSQDLRAVWALGYFQNVELLVQRLPRGLAYVIRVEERPIVRAVQLRGNEELNKDDLKDEIDTKPNTILDMETVRSTVRKIQAKYVEKGYFLAEVTHELKRSEDGTSVDVIYVINEHAKVMVKQITFIGAEKVSPEELKATMITREGGFFSFFTGEGTYREEAFERDLQVIQFAYYDRGFINVRVDKPTVQLSADKRFIYITLRVTEGEAYDIGKIDFSGDLLEGVSKELMESLMKSRTGERFNRSQLSQDIVAVSDLYYDRGYAYANINPITTVNADNRTVDLTFDVQQGPKVTIERIEVVGNSKTRDKVIRRELRVYEGELYSGTGVRRSRERVTALGFFETVEITQRPGSQDDTIVLQVEVKEKATGTFQVGLGFSNVENFIFTAQISQNNFLGWGQSISASAQISGLRSLVQLSFYDPYFLDTNYLLSAEFFRVQADYEGFIRNSTGGSVSIGYQFIDDLLGTVGYSREWVDVEAGQNLGAVLLANQFLSGITSAARFSLSFDRRDNRLFPSRGFIHYGSVETAPGFLGGTFLFNRYTAYSRLYFPMPLGFVFKTNATIGYIQQLDQDKPLPISELYYVGGINSVRGYYLRSISPSVKVPRSANPDATVTDFLVGGNKQLIFNFELEFPIFEKAGLRGVLFYDAGNSFATTENFFEDRQDNLPLGLFHSAGFGFRWFSPIGPLRFEWGIPLTRRPEDDRILFEFTIGNFF